MPRRLLAIGLSLVALAYLCAGAFLYAAQDRFLYFPQFTRVAPELTNFSLKRDEIILRGWVVNPGQRAALIYFGGNGEPIERQREKLGPWLPARTIYLLAYRGYGASDGVPGEAAMFADALALYDEVRATHDKVAVIGRSLGSGIASYVAAQRDVQRLVLVTPFDSIARVAQARYPMFPAAWLLHDKFESWRYAAQVRCPVLMLEAQDDEVVSDARTQTLRAAFTTPPEFIRIAQANHNSISRDPAYARAISEFLQP